MLSTAFLKVQESKSQNLELPWIVHKWQFTIDESLKHQTSTQTCLYDNHVSVFLSPQYFTHLLSSMTEVMFSKETLETNYGNLEVEIFQFSLWSKCLFLVLWTLAIISNLFGLVYIYKKLSLTNVINLVPFLEGIINVIGFMVIGINCLISIIDVSYGNFSCEANSITLLMMTVCGKNMILI